MTSSVVSALSVKAVLSDNMVIRWPTNSRSKNEKLLRCDTSFSCGSEKAENKMTSFPCRA
jgi:hypothetical protein